MEGQNAAGCFTHFWKEKKVKVKVAHNHMD